jgi:hypothetical protein
VLRAPQFLAGIGLCLIAPRGLLLPSQHLVGADNEPPEMDVEMTAGGSLAGKLSSSPRRRA